MKNLKQLIESNHWLNVAYELWNLIEVDNPLQKKFDIMDKYQVMFNQLKNDIVPNNPHNLQIIIKEENKSDPYDEELSYDCIYHFDPLDGQEYAPDFTDWSEWIDMEIYPQTLELYNPEEIIAHCLFEMSYDGFQQENTINAKNKLISRINQTASDLNKGDLTT